VPAGRDRPSPLSVVAVILFALAIVMCAGLVGYVVRQLVDDDDPNLSDLFSSVITHDQPVEGSMTT
jgi:hypothetical protein